MQGRCLCGRVTWQTDGAPRSVHHCHCSMCRRATGAGVATLAWFERSGVHWPAELPATYPSSAIAERGFCPHCGTSLYLAYRDRSDIALMAGSFEYPASLKPTHHYGCESKLVWADLGPFLPEEDTKESLSAGDESAGAAPGGSAAPLS